MSAFGSLTIENCCKYIWVSISEIIIKSYILTLGSTSVFCYALHEEYFNDFGLDAESVLRMVVCMTAGLLKLVGNENFHTMSKENKWIWRYLFEDLHVTFLFWVNVMLLFFVVLFLSEPNTKFISSCLDHRPMLTLAKLPVICSARDSVSILYNSSCGYSNHGVRMVVVDSLILFFNLETSTVPVS